MPQLLVSDKPAEYLDFQHVMLEDTSVPIDVFEDNVKDSDSSKILGVYNAEFTTQWRGDVKQLISDFAQACPDYFSKVAARLGIIWHYGNYSILLTSHLTCPGIASPQFTLDYIAIGYSKGLAQYDYSFLIAHEFIHVAFFEFFHHTDRLSQELQNALFQNKISELFPYLVLFESDFGWLADHQMEQRQTMVEYLGEETLSKFITTYRQAESLESFISDNEQLFLAA